MKRGIEARRDMERETRSEKGENGNRERKMKGGGGKKKATR